MIAWLFPSHNSKREEQPDETQLAEALNTLTGAESAEDMQQVLEARYSTLTSEQALLTLVLTFTQEYMQDDQQLASQLQQCLSIIEYAREHDVPQAFQLFLAIENGTEDAEALTSAAGLGTRLRRGTVRRAAKAPRRWRSDSRERRGSRVSSPPPASGSPMTECTITGLPSGSRPAASQPRMMGSRSRRCRPPQGPYVVMVERGGLDRDRDPSVRGHRCGRSPRSSPASG